VPKKRPSRPPNLDPFESSSSSAAEEDEDEEEDLETVRRKVKTGALPKKTYSTRGARKTYKESESEDDGDMKVLSDNSDVYE
jgi:hypothetical protein